MNDDKIESLLNEIESSLKLILFTLWLFALGSCYLINDVCDDVKDYIQNKVEVKQ